MKKKFTIGVLVTIITIMFNQILIQYALNQKQNDAYYINLAGRQRMLSQKINADFYKIIHHKKEVLINELKKDYQKWQEAHFILLKMKLNTTQDIKINNEINGLTSTFQSIKFFIDKSIDNQNIEIILIDNYLDNFLRIMDNIVKELEIEADNKLFRIICLEVFLAIMTGIIFFLAVRYIYYPITKKITQLNEQIYQQSKYIFSIYNSSNEACSFIDKDFVIRYVNQTAKNITKQMFGKEAQIGDKSLYFTLPQYREEFEKYYYQVLEGKTIITEKTSENNNKKEYWKVSLVPVHDTENILVGIAHNVQNITEQKNYELRIIKQNKILREIAWQQSHEVRSPVATILGLINLLKTDNHSIEDINMYLGYLEIATEKLDAIIHEIVAKTNYEEE